MAHKEAVSNGSMEVKGTTRSRAQWVPQREKHQEINNSRKPVPSQDLKGMGERRASLKTRESFMKKTPKKKLRPHRLGCGSGTSPKGVC